MPVERFFNRAIAIRRVYREPVLQHHPFFYVPCYDDAMQWLFFVAHVNGGPKIFGEIRSENRLLQITSREDLNEWSLHPSHDGRFVYYTAASGAYRTNLETLQEEELANFSGQQMKAPGSVGDAMGVTSLSRDDRWWAIPIRCGNAGRIYIVDTSTGGVSCAVEAPRAFHPQFHPDDAMLLRYSGPHDARIWTVHRDGSGNRLVYQRNADRKEWVVHETWLPGARDLLAVDWRHGVFQVNADDGCRQEVSALNAWHPVASRAGQWVVTDTRNPDLGICVFQLGGNQDEFAVICRPEASNQGSHWDADYCPYDDGPLTPNAPQHTHPHPHPSPDGRFIVFTTDAPGSSSVMEAELENPLK